MSDGENMSIDDEFYKQLSNRPAVLFLGQRTLAMETGTDPLLSEIRRRYPDREVSGGSEYECSLISKNDASRDHYIEWLRERCRRVTSPEWQQVVGQISWSSVFTSAIDTVTARSFDQEWRELYPIFEEKIKPFDPRNRIRLHFTYLFGSVGRIEASEQAPVTKLELTRRRHIALALGRRIPEVVSPLGLLIVEGYSPKNDWFSSEDFFPILDSLGKGQIHFFSSSEDFNDDPYIAELISSGKALLHGESLASTLNRGNEGGWLKIGVPLNEVDAQNCITINDEVIALPLEVRAQTVKSAIILDDQILLPPPEISRDRQYSEFRDFLSDSSLKPSWKGFARGFAFKRNFEADLYSIVDKSLANAGNMRKPIILHGQTGTGKTVACGSLAYAIKKAGQFPVLFIEKRTNRPNYRDISNFCEWVENNGAAATLVIWDGMVEIQQYEELVRFLLSRGKKAIVVGTSYKKPLELNNEFFVEASDRFEPNELENLQKFVRKFEANPEAVVHAMSKADSSTFLVALYRYLPSTRPRVQAGVVEEVGYAEEKILRKAKDEPIKPFYSSLAQALMTAGVANDESIKLEEIAEVAGDSIMRLEEVIGLIMVPGSFGLTVPLELLVRAFGILKSEQLVKTLGESDVFRWIEDDVGNIFVGPRQSLEAKLLIRSRLGSPATEVEYAKKLLLEIRDGSISYENVELNFGMELLKSLGPNGANPQAYLPYFRNISDILRKLRTERGVINSRLMLQEAFFVREFVIKSDLAVSEAIELLDRAEETLQEALDELPVERRQNKLRSFLLVERASTLGAKAQTLAQYETSKDIFGQLHERIRRSILEARTLEPEGFRPVDVLFWTSSHLLTANLLDESAKGEVLAEIFHAIDAMNDEELGGSEREQFERRKMEISSLLELPEMEDKAFRYLQSVGSTAGYYLRARKLLQSLDMSRPLESATDVENCQAAYDYLSENIDEIATDGRCLYLLLRVWWLITSSHPIFFEEKQTVPFKREDWEFILQLIERLVQAGEQFRRPALLYLQAVAYFHLNDLEKSNTVFKEIAFEPEEVQGRRRIIKSYLASNSNGTTRVFSGNVSSAYGTKGRVFVEELGREIPFNAWDFGRPDIQAGETLPKFYIGFNFIGMIAESTKIQRKGR